MKAIFGFVLLALVAATFANVSESAGSTNEYLPPEASMERASGQQHKHHMKQNGEKDEDMDSMDVNMELTENDETNGSMPDADEPMPAHMLKADGYHYKVPESRKFFY